MDSGVLGVRGRLTGKDCKFKDWYLNLLQDASFCEEDGTEIEDENEEDEEDEVAPVEAVLDVVPEEDEEEDNVEVFES